METIKSNLNKAMRFALTFFIMAAVATTFTACGDDDDEPGIDGDLIGTWSYTGPDYESGYTTCTLTFKKDGTAQIHEEFTDFPEDNYTQSIEYSVEGDLSSGATLRLWGHDLDGEFTDITFLATLSGKKLTLVGLTGEVQGERRTFTRN